MYTINSSFVLCSDVLESVVLNAKVSVVYQTILANANILFTNKRCSYTVITRCSNMHIVLGSRFPVVANFYHVQ